jgi:DNA-binding response OmpR family regulator
VYARYLDRHHFKIETASTPHELSAALIRTRPAAVLIEAELGGVAVWEVADWPSLQGVPVIVLAGGSGEGLSAHGAFSPAAVLRKPFELSTMIEVVRGALRTHPAR